MTYRTAVSRVGSGLGWDRQRLLRLSRPATRSRQAPPRALRKLPAQADQDGGSEPGWHAYHQDHHFAITMLDEDGQPLPFRIEGGFRVGATSFSVTATRAL